MLRENVRRTAKILCLFMAVLLLIGSFPVIASATSDTIAVVTKPTEPVIENAKEPKGSFIGTLIAIIVTAIVATVITNYRAFKRQQQLEKYHNQSYANLMKENQALRNLKKATNLELISAQNRITALEDWRNRAISVVPGLTESVRMSYAKDKADAYQKKYYHLDSVNPTYSTYSQFESAIADYNLLSEDVQKQITGIDINRFKQKRKLALTDFVATAQKRLAQTDAQEADDLHKYSLMLGRVLEWYESLPDIVKSEIPSNVITSIRMKKANTDYTLEITTPSNESDSDNSGSNGHGINKLMDSFVNGSSKLFGKATSWVSSKINETRKVLNDPFDNSYYEDDAEFDEEDEEETSNKNNDEKQDKPPISQENVGNNSSSSESSTENSSTTTVTIPSVDPGNTYTL